MVELLGVHLNVVRLCEIHQPVELGRDNVLGLAVDLSLVQAQQASSRGVATWQKARKGSDYSLFSGDLGHLIELKRQEAAAVSPDGNAYDALLDEYEPGATAAEVEPLFADLRRELAPIVRGVEESHVEVDESPALGRFPVAAQRRFGVAVAEAMGFDFGSGRLDDSAHPFCTGIDPGDVRMTWVVQSLNMLIKAGLTEINFTGAANPLEG